MRVYQLYEKATLGSNFYITVPSKQLTDEFFSSGKLVGVQGVSASPHILREFGPHVGRDVLITMPVASTLAANSLTEIEYTNPDALLADGARLLRRVCSNNLPNAMRSVLKELGLDGDLNIYDVNPTGDDASAWKQIIIDNIEKSTSFSKRKMLERLSQPDVEQKIKEGIVRFASIWIDEQEWIVNNGTLQIPSDARILYMKDEHYGIPEMEDKIKSLPYNVRVVDGKATTDRLFHAKVRHNRRKYYNA